MVALTDDRSTGADRESCEFVNLEMVLAALMDMLLVPPVAGVWVVGCCWLTLTC